MKLTFSDVYRDTLSASRMIPVTTDDTCGHSYLEKIKKCTSAF